jgi:hypothetical protein
MKTVFVLLAIMITLLLRDCPPGQTYNGYGRYVLRINVDKVNIDGNLYDVTMRAGDVVVDAHTLSRGIYRKTRPWLYLHQETDTRVDITSEEGLKEEYPLYTGSGGSIFEVLSKPWDIKQSTCAAFANNCWLVFHRWVENGVLVDLQQQTGSVKDWRLLRGDILLPDNGSEVSISEINTKVGCVAFNFQQKTARVKFTSLQ